ncbi:uncharacterized protein N7482_001042 [Penicillium canariense]|uniref:DUF7580 domain-containing protein n=1 Tax=Penicillium canariense TaxID=189055 RepID=A0A9W9IFT7_9EURO|nr:uncharacterized protein N7482_001042 [Penicillium canariense]KAJ5175165.1 hypothetical protein N7482_001042 [Penicillium canariense]
MVTGVETAGLVLGAIPIIISALENYENLAAPTQAFIHWKRHLRRLIRELYTIHTSYDQAVRLLLKPFADLTDQTTMMEDSRSALWREGDIADSLRDKLGPVYGPFILTIDEVSEILVEIAACLNIPGSQQVFTSKNLLPVVFSNLQIANTPFLHRNFEFRQRIKFTMKKNRVKAALERLEACTRMIDAWTTRADRMQDEIPQSRLKLKFSASLGTIQENATKVHRAISRTWCNDNPVHVAHLLLEQRLVRSKKRKRPLQTLQAASSNLVAQATSFGLSLRGDCNASSQWLNSEIRIDELPSRSAGTVRVTISGPEDDHDPAILHHITTLCKVIRQPPHPFVVFCLNDTGFLKSRPSLKGTAAEYVQHSLSLEALLPHFEARLPITEVYGLAITLIASIFQLSHTPWLETKWSKRNIVFARANSNTPLTVDLRYPSLVKEYHRGVGPRRPADTPINTTCSNLLALAIMLLEISSGRPVEQRLGDDQITNILPNDQSYLQLAGGWFKEEKSHGRLSNAFSQAILTCLQEYLNPDANFDDDQYCNAFKEKALLPLEEEMDHLLFGPPR